MKHLAALAACHAFPAFRSVRINALARLFDM